MKDFFTGIFQYQHHYNQLFAAQVIDNRPLIPDESFALFCHILNAHQIWNARILGLPAFGVQELHPLESLKTIDAVNFKDSLLVLNDVDLEATVVYKNTKGQEFSNQVKDVLFHISNHSTHHRAQLSSKFRSLGISPLISDFIFYKRDPRLSHS